jgi:hypothetical protein
LGVFEVDKVGLNFLGNSSMEPESTVELAITTGADMACPDLLASNAVAAIGEGNSARAETGITLEVTEAGKNCSEDCSEVDGVE